MKNKNIFIAAGVLVVILLVVLFSRSGTPATSPGSEGSSGKTPGTTVTSSKSTKTAGQKPTAVNTSAKPAPSFPDIEFIDKMTDFPLKNYPNIKIAIEKVVFGRGDAANSTGCSGIPNVNFSTYLYPGSGICLGAAEVDGSPRGIVAFHMLIDNRSNVGFGGNSNILQLHYLRSDSSGTPSFRFAHPIMGLENYYIEGYSSKKIILSYVVPQDQTIFNLVSGYKEPALENKTLNVYDFSASGLLVDFESKTLKVIK